MLWLLLVVLMPIVPILAGLWLWWSTYRQPELQQEGAAEAGRVEGPAGRPERAR